MLPHVPSAPAPGFAGGRRLREHEAQSVRCRTGSRQAERLHHLVRPPDARRVAAQAHREARDAVARALDAQLLHQRAQVVLATLLAARVDPGKRLAREERLDLRRAAPSVAAGTSTS